METFVKPTTRVRFEDSGSIKTVAPKPKLNQGLPVDDIVDVQLNKDQYRIVMHCRRETDRITMEKIATNQ